MGEVDKAAPAPEPDPLTGIDAQRWAQEFIALVFTADLITERDALRAELASAREEIAKKDANAVKG